MRDDAQAILDVLRLSERLKCELRHSWLSSGRRESVAEHTWQMALMAMLVGPHLERSLDVSRCVQMAIVHDLVEAKTGDVPSFDADGRVGKQTREGAAMREIVRMLPGRTAPSIEALWREFERGETAEARLVKALDKLEVQLQHNLADLGTWEDVEYHLVYTETDRYCAHDAFLRALCERIVDQAETKMRRGGVDVAQVRCRARER